MGFFENLITDEIKNEVEAPQEVAAGGLIKPGVYKMVIDKAYARKVDSGAVKVEIEFKYKREDGTEGTFFWGGFVQSGDAKDNRAYWTDKDGKKHPLPDLVLYKRICEAAGVPDPQVKDAVIEIFDDQVHVKAMPELTGKIVTLGIRHTWDDYKEKDVAFIEAVLDKDGKNSKGEFLEDKLKEKIEKSPYREKKKKKEPKQEQTNLEKSPW